MRFSRRAQALTASKMTFLDANDPTTVQAQSTFGAPQGIASVDDMLARAYSTNLWPVKVRTVRSYTPNDGPVPGMATVGEFANGATRVLAQHGSSHTSTTPDQWASILRVAESAGARPFFVGATKGGGRLIACFDVGTPGGAIKSTLVLGDSYDGTLRLLGGFCASRNRCANMIASVRKGDCVSISHRSGLPEQIERLKRAIVAAIDGGAKVAELYARAEQAYMPPALAKRALDMLCPIPGPEASATTVTRATNFRAEVIAAAQMPINRIGDESGNLATLWNGRTYVADRLVTGEHRKCNGNGSSLDSMIFGTRAREVNEVQEMIEVLLADGTIVSRTRGQASEMGVPVAQALGVGSIFDLEVSPT